MKRALLLFLSVCLLCALSTNFNGGVTVYKAPEGEVLNAKFKVSVNGIDVPVYNAKIGHENKVEREKAKDVRLESHLYYDLNFCKVQECIV